jgi:hypothetical protein
VTPLLVSGWNTTRAARAVVHDVLGRPDPEVTYRPAATRSGTLTFMFESLADAQRCESMHASGVVLTIADALTGTMRYVVSGDVILNAENDRGSAWSVTVSFREVV